MTILKSNIIWKAKSYINTNDLNFQKCCDSSWQGFAKKKKSEFLIQNGYIKNYWALESQLDTKLQSVQDQNLIKELVMHWYNRGPGFKPYSGL